MNILENHPEYDERHDDWERVTDSLNKVKIKLAGVKYLARTGGQTVYFERTGSNAAYDAYKGRARFPSLVYPAVLALTGIAHRLPYDFEAPDRFIEMCKTITAGGEPLEELSRKCVSRGLQHGRYGLLADVDFSGNPYISIINAISIKDWETESIGGREVLVYVKIQESHNQSPIMGTRDIVQRYRILSLVDGFYTCEIYDDSGVLVNSALAEKASKQRLDYIPFVIAGSVDLRSACDESPMLALADTAINIYQLDADYRQSLHMTSQPTPVITGAGNDDEGTVRYIGSSNVWYLSEGSTAEYLEVSGKGLTAQKDEINDEYARGAKIGGELSSDSGRAESGEAIKLRMFSRHASLFSVAAVAGAAIDKALKMCADIVSITGPISFKPNLDFTGSDISDALMLILHNGTLSGTTPVEVYWQTLRDVGVTNKTDEELRDLIEQGGSESE